jgi:hypothetical protein
MSDYTRIKLRRSLSNEWNNINPILDIGEAGYETDSLRLKIGDGTTAWSGLDYIRIHPSSLSFPTINLKIGDGYDQRVGINLSNNELLNITASGDTILSYDDSTKTLSFNTQAGLSYVTRSNVINALGYVPQITGRYSLIGHTHLIGDIGGLQEILDNKQPTGNYAAPNHNHNLRISVGDGRVLNYTTNEFLNIAGSGYTNVNIDDYTNTLIISSLGNSGVLTFNNRSGTVNLNYTDITGALRYIPQPTGNYAASGHYHSIDQIVDLDKLGWTFNNTTNSWKFDYPIITNIDRRTPLSSTDSGNPGDICWDASYMYLCVGVNLWHRSVHNSW